ncbi:MAG TPA: YciI family protein [Streptosporangiaceae bacterium]|nr:YciI family protein [Streptosporangiaceae bacterium]
MRYVLIHVVDGDVELGAAGPAQVHADSGIWLEEMISRGVSQYGGRLRPAGDATTVRVRRGEVLIADGPFAETKEQVAGFDVIECADLGTALDVAARHPAARLGGIEVRPLWAS